MLFATSIKQFPLQQKLITSSTLGRKIIAVLIILITTTVICFDINAMEESTAPVKLNLALGQGLTYNYIPAFELHAYQHLTLFDVYFTFPRDDWSLGTGIGFLALPPPSNQEGFFGFKGVSGWRLLFSAERVFPGILIGLRTCLAFLEYWNTSVLIFAPDFGVFSGIQLINFSIDQRPVALILEPSVMIQFRQDTRISLAGYASIVLRI